MYAKEADIMTSPKTVFRSGPEFRNFKWRQTETTETDSKEWHSGKIGVLTHWIQL